MIYMEEDTISSRKTKKNHDKHITLTKKKSIDINENWGMWQVSKPNEFTNKWHSVPSMQYYESEFCPLYFSEYY